MEHQGDTGTASVDETQAVRENGLHVILEDEPQVVPEDEPQVVPEDEPQVVAEDEPQVVPENGPQVIPEDEPQVVPEDEPQVIPEDEVVLEDEPPVVPEDEGQVVPDEEGISEEDWNRLFIKGKFKKEDMNMMIMDFLIDQELPIVAEAFHRESGCPVDINSQDLSHVGTQKIVKDLIMNRQIDEAIQTLNETMKPVFLQVCPHLRFLLEQQKMIELCRRGDFNAALDLSRKFIMWESFETVCDDFSFKKECRLTLLLMLFGDDKASPASALLDHRKIYWLASLVVEKMIQYQGRKKGNCIDKAWRMVGWIETELYQKVMFPFFNFNSGYPKRMEWEHYI